MHLKSQQKQEERIHSYTQTPFLQVHYSLKKVYRKKVNKIACGLNMSERGVEVPESESGKCLLPSDAPFFCIAQLLYKNISLFLFFGSPSMDFSHGNICSFLFLTFLKSLKMNQSVEEKLESFSSDS